MHDLPPWRELRTNGIRMAAMVGMQAGPYTRRGPSDLLETVQRTRGPLHYMVTFQRAGVGEQLLGADVPSTFRGLMRRPKIRLEDFQQLPERIRALPATLFVGDPDVMGEPFLDDSELDVFVRAFQRTGFTGALNWYRNLARNWHDTAGTPDSVLVPALMVCAGDDYFLPPATTKGMEAIVPDLERRLLHGCGHWTQQERPEEVNAILVEWLSRRIRSIA